MANFEAVWWLSVWIYRAHTGLCGSFRLAASGQEQTLGNIDDTPK